MDILGANTKTDFIITVNQRSVQSTGFHPKKYHNDKKMLWASILKKETNWERKHWEKFWKKSESGKKKKKE